MLLLSGYGRLRFQWDKLTVFDYYASRYKDIQGIIYPPFYVLFISELILKKLYGIWNVLLFLQQFDYVLSYLFISWLAKLANNLPDRFSQTFQTFSLEWLCFLSLLFRFPRHFPLRIICRRMFSFRLIDFGFVGCSRLNLFKLLKVQHHIGRINA